MEKFKARYFKQQYQYKSFTPFLINKQFEWENKDIDILLEKATRFLGELNSYSLLIPDIELFIKMNVKKESTTSNLIEGTKTKIDEVILPEEEIKKERKDDWLEVQNYIKAINFSIKELEKLPFSIRLIKETHKILLSETRGEKKSPGEIRKSQNWIGGSNLSDAFFIPPHPDDLSELLSDLEKFWHNKKLNIPLLIKIAIFHYQFETIHPFLDGNGRMGRLIIILQLIDSGLLKTPSLYLSSFFEKNKEMYFNSLNIVRKENDIEQWIIFFLKGIIEISLNTKETFEKIIELRKEYEEKISKMEKRKKEKAKKLLLELFSNPVISIKESSKKLNIGFSTSNRLLSEFVKLKMVKEITGYSRNRLFVLFEYLNLFRG
jgi:Fic family protein